MHHTKERTWLALQNPTDDLRRRTRVVAQAVMGTGRYHNRAAKTYRSRSGTLRTRRFERKLAKTYSGNGF